jgi:pectate lyase
MLDNSQSSLDSSLGGQPSTQNPQTSATGNLGGSGASDVQPVSSTDLLSTAQAGMPLVVNSLSVVSLEGTVTTSQTVAKPVIHHKTNNVMLGLAATLFIAALVMFWVFSRQAKITTK